MAKRVRPLRRRRRASRGLGPRDRATIRGLVQSDVVDTFEGLEPFLRRSMWLGKNNRYSKNTINRIFTELRSAPQKLLKPRQLSQYIAASSILHCADGWSYLGKAISAILQGDPHRARHFAYYAELRAALSLLATEGVGVFDQQHFVIKGENSVVKLDSSKGTHQMVWNCLEYWGSRPQSGALFSKVVRPYGRTLADWLDPLGGGGTVAAQAHQWFRQWGMDLKIFAADRNSRNESSYRPDGIPNFWTLETSSAIKFVREIWEVLEPDPSSSFEIVDSHILRIALESRYQGIHGHPPAEQTEHFAGWISAVLNNQDFPEPVKERWLRFLTRQRDPQNISILAHSTEAPTEGCFGIISRAALLLRVSAGATAELIKDAGQTVSSFSFWWKKLGKARGLWPDDKEPPLSDLWADVQPSLDRIIEFESEHQAAGQTFFQAAEEIGASFIALSGCERVALWSLPSEP